MASNQPTIHKTITGSYDAGSFWFGMRMQNVRTATIEPGMLVSIQTTNLGSTYIGGFLDPSSAAPHYRLQYGVAKDRIKSNENGIVLTHGVVTNLWAIGTITGGDQLVHDGADQFGIVSGFGGLFDGGGIGIALETNANTNLKKIKAFIGYKV